MRRVLGLLFVALVLAGLVGYARPADAGVRTTHTVNRPVLVARSNAPEYSFNWSGYAVPAGGRAITEVTGAWRVPAVKNAPPGLSSSWVGIGGYGTQDLIQVGTASSGRIDGNHAWFEMLPDPETPITSGCAGDDSCGVAQGDTMVARVSLVGGNVWNIFLTNFGKSSSPKWSWSTTVNYNSTLSSAEWIFEAPQIGVRGVIGGIQTMPAHAPHAQFLGGASYKINGENRSLGAGASRMMMIEQWTGFLLGPKLAYRTATPSILGRDSHFQVCAYERTCPNV